MSPTLAIALLVFYFVASFAMAYLGTRSGARLGYRHEAARQKRGIRGRRVVVKRRLLAEAIVQARQASIVGTTQSIGGEGDELARHAALTAKAAIGSVVGKKQVAEVFHRYVVEQARRGFQRSDRAHEAVHRRLMLDALGQLPTSLLEKVAASEVPELEMGCDGHVFRMPREAAAAEARRILDARGSAE
ncbi:hypothetical protein ACFVTX_18110 [Agromyces sp. NPDC058136]|uniref:hypothetical protein n=1 Tax=Agromyces sp. NPDC058136 TaxID=3346354 RepID=UPI0036D84C4D